MTRDTYKLVKIIGNSEEIITKSFYPMYPKMEMETLREEFQKMIDAGCLKASIFIPIGGSSFRLTYTKGSKIVDVWYDLRVETNYDIR
jgi:hypothetical protein